MEMKWKKLDEGIKIFLYIIIGLTVLYLFLLMLTLHASYTKVTLCD